MAQAHPGRLPASHSMGVGGAHDGPGTGTRSPRDQYWSLIIKKMLAFLGGYPRAPRPGGPGPPRRSVLRDQGASGRPRQGGCSKISFFYFASPDSPDPLAPLAPLNPLAPWPPSPLAPLALGRSGPLTDHRVEGIRPSVPPGPHWSRFVLTRPTAPVPPLHLSHICALEGRANPGGARRQAVQSSLCRWVGTFVIQG